MTVLVEPYELKEFNRSSAPACDECDYPPMWEMKQIQEGGAGSLGFACSEHVHNVLYLVDRGLTELKSIPINLELG